MLIMLSTGFAIVAILLLLAWPVIVLPPGLRGQAMATPAARSMAAWICTLALFAATAPLVVSALISGSETVQFVAHHFETMSFGT